MTFSPDDTSHDLIGELLELELDAELRAQVVVDTAVRHNLDPLTLASWIFRPAPPGRRIHVGGMRRLSMVDCIELQAPEHQRPPMLGESAWSFAARVAEANGYIGALMLQRFVRMYLGWYPTSAATASYHWYWLAPRFHTEVHSWLNGRETVRWAPGSYRLLRPFCPKCIRQDQIFMESWEHGETCAIHGLAPQQRCYRCGDEVSWRSGSLRACRCGASFESGSVSRPLLDDGTPDLSETSSQPLPTHSAIAMPGERLNRYRRPQRWTPKSCHFGGCACGSVIVEVIGKPLSMGLCHCTACRHTGAHPRGFCVFMKKQVNLRGETMHWSHGPMRKRVGCSRCGAPVLSLKFRAETVELYASVLDDPKLFEPQFEQWTSKRMTWTAPLQVPQFADSRPPGWRPDNSK